MLSAVEGLKVAAPRVGVYIESLPGWQQAICAPGVGAAASGAPAHNWRMRRTPWAVTPVAPGPGQESAWDFPRPPRVEPTGERVIVRFGGLMVADSRAAVRVLETSHPPVYYLPREAFAPGVLISADGSSVCEFKGTANYLDLDAGGTRALRAAWYYPDPSPGYEVLRGRVALYPGAMDACEIDGELVVPQEGGFYGGWITSRVVGPFKGGPGTLGW